MDEFEKKFKFDPDYVGYMGAEEELWTVDSAGRLIPAAIRLFEMIGEDGDIKPELPAQQVEAVTGKCATVQELYDNIEQNRIRLDDLGREFGFEILSESIPPGRFELIPYPKKRYKQIMQQYSKSVLRHAWIAGLHLHIGCSSKEAAIYFVNCFRNDLPALLGFSAGPISPEGYASERFFSYSEMCPDLVPPYLESFEHYTELAKEREFYDDPRRCWWLIRINPHGTVELRVFDAQPDAISAAELASLVMQRYLLYRDRLLGPVEDLDVESLQDQLENAAIQGTSYWECDPWEEETKEKVQEHLPLCRRLYEFNIT